MDKVFKSGITNLRKTLTRQQTTGDKRDEKNGMLFGIQTSHLLPDEIANKEMTEAQKRRATRAASVQMDQDNEVLGKQLDPKRLEEGFDPVVEIFNDIPEDEDVMDAWMAKQEAELTSELKIIDEQVNHVASKNYNDFLKGIEMIQEIDLDLSRADIFVENSRMKLQRGRSITESGLSISAERRRLSRLIKVDSIIDVFRLLIDEERQMNSCIDDNDYVSAVKIATDIKQTLDEFNFSQYTSFATYIQRINAIFPTLRQQLHQSLKEVLLSFDLTTYVDIYKAYLYLDKALSSSSEEIPSMSDRILKAATEAIQEQALTDLRIYLHDHTDTIKIPEELIDSMGFMGLAKEIPVAHIYPALVYIMNGVCIILHNHYLLTQVHAYCDLHADEVDLSALTPELLHTKSIMKEHEELQANNEEDVNTLLRKQLDKSRSSVWHSAQKIIGDFINVSKLDNAEMRLPKFREVYNVCQFFMKFGLTFSKTTSNDLLNALRVKGYLYYNTIEKNTLEKLKQALSTETWNVYADLNGISTLLNISQIDKSNMKSEEEIEKQLSTAFTNWLFAGSPIAPDTKIPYPIQTLPELGTIPSSFPAVLTNSLIQGFIRPLGSYLDFMISIPLAADTAFSGITKLIDTYVYSVFNLFTPEETMRYLFSDPDIPPPVYKSLTTYIRRIWLENFPEVDPNEVNEDTESSPGRSPLSSPGRSPNSPGRSPRFLDVLLDNESDEEDYFPPPMFENSPDIYEDVYSHMTSRRMIAAETCKLIIEVMNCVRALVQQLSFSKSGESVVNYFSVLPDIINDLHSLLYNSSAEEILENNDFIEDWVSKSRWELKSVNTEHSTYVPNVIALLHTIQEYIEDIKMPEVCISNFYREVAECIMEHLYVAYANVKKCNNEGRQQMQLDIDEIWTLLTSIHKIEPPILKDDKYIKNYLKACMFNNEGDFLNWVNSEYENYSYEDIVDLINNNLAKKINKQKLKGVTQAVDSIYGIQQ